MVLGVTYPTMVPGLYIPTMVPGLYIPTQGGRDLVYTHPEVGTWYIPTMVPPYTPLGIPPPYRSTGYTDTRVLSAGGESPGLSSGINSGYSWLFLGYLRKCDVWYAF